MKTAEEAKEVERSESEDETIPLENRKHLVLNELPENTNKIAFNKDNLGYLESDAKWSDLGLEKPFIDRLMQLSFKKPSKIQNELITMARNHDVVAQAQNGSGKTLAYLVPTILAAKNASASPPTTEAAAPLVVIIADTNALIQQISRILQSIVSGIYDIVVDELYSGKRDVKRNCAVLVSTMAQVRNSQMRKTVDFSRLALLVVDEADHVFEQDTSKNFFQVFFTKAVANTATRFIFTSATLTDEFREVIKSLQERRSVIIIEKETEELTLKNVTQYMIRYSSSQQKMDFLAVVLQKLNAQNVLIFDNRKKDLAALTQFLKAREYKAELVCKSDAVGSAAARAASEIQRKIEEFLAGKYRVMLTTNLLSRGIDMRKVTLVINFSLPYKFSADRTERGRMVDVETYLHRVGRTGRFGDFGIALNFVSSREESEMLNVIKDHYKNEIKEINLDDMHVLDRQLKEIDEANRETREYIENNI